MTQMITLDCDGTVFDPWACCGHDDVKTGSPKCRHLRHDTMAKVANLRAVYHDAELVVLSWRAGLERTTAQWLGFVGIEVAAVFVPGSPDTRKLGAPDGTQVGFKVNVARALSAAGVELVASFDDNLSVVEALRGVGVPALHVPHLVDVHQGRIVDRYNVEALVG